MHAGILERVRDAHRVLKQVLAGVLAFGFVGAASAYTLSITPADQTTTVGSQIGVSITASDFLQAGGLGAYNFDLSFEAGVLGFDHVADGLGLGAAFGLDYALAGNVLSFTDTSFDDPATLLAGQSPSFTLFTIYFNALGEGTSFLSLSGVTLADAYGNSMNEYSQFDGSVTVQGGVTAPIPEPGTLPLIALGGLACLWVQRRNRATRNA